VYIRSSRCSVHFVSAWYTCFKRIHLVKDFDKKKTLLICAVVQSLTEKNDLFSPMTITVTQVNDVRRETVGMQRERVGSWKQYSDGFRRIPVLSGRIHPETIGKNPGHYRPEYCFHVPGISLKDPVTFPYLSWKIRWQERSNWVHIFIKVRCFLCSTNTLVTK